MLFVAESLGSFLAMLACVTLGGFLAKAFFMRFIEETSKDNVVDATDALIALGEIVISYSKLMKSHWVATVCTVAVFTSLTAMSEISVFASLGYSTLAFAIVGFVSPALLRRMKRSSSVEVKSTSDST